MEEKTHLKIDDTETFLIPEMQFSHRYYCSMRIAPHFFVYILVSSGKNAIFTERLS